MNKHDTHMQKPVGSVCINPPTSWQEKDLIKSTHTRIKIKRQAKHQDGVTQDDDDIK